MPQMSDDARGALGYWGSISASVNERASTAEVWSAIRQAATDNGLSSPGVTIQGVNQLRGYATQIRNASERLDRARSDETLDSRYVITAPWSRDLQSMNAAPQYQIRFEHTMNTDSGELTTWRSAVVQSLPGPTVGDLNSYVTDVGALMGDEYEGEFVGTGSIQVLAI